jgi:hypothetical protein
VAGSQNFVLVGNFSADGDRSIDLQIRTRYEQLLVSVAGLFDPLDPSKD